jgi:predicted dehydrogenase
MQTLRWGIIGCGDIVRRRVGPAIGALGSHTLRAVARRDAARLEDCRDALGAARGYGDWRALLGDEQIDAVYVATPVDRHAAHVVAAAQAGKHVLCEKPLGLNAEECRRMVAACRSCGVQLGVAYYRRHYPVVARLKALIAAGEIGRVLLARFEAAETFMPAAAHPRRWILDRQRGGGGCLMDFGCHRIELLLHLFGPVRFAAGTVGKGFEDHDVEDAASVALSFPGGASGLVTVIRGGTQNYDRMWIEGTRGVLHVAAFNQGVLTISTTAGARQEAWPCHANPHQPLIEAFSTAILAGRTPEVDGQMGLAVQEIIDRVYAAAADWDIWRGSAGKHGAQGGQR